MRKSVILVLLAIALVSAGFIFGCAQETVTGTTTTTIATTTSTAATTTTTPAETTTTTTATTTSTAATTTTTTSTTSTTSAGQAAAASVGAATGGAAGATKNMSSVAETIGDASVSTSSLSQVSGSSIASLKALLVEVSDLVPLTQDLNALGEITLSGIVSNHDITLKFITTGSNTVDADRCSGKQICNAINWDSFITGTPSSAAQIVSALTTWNSNKTYQNITSAYEYMLWSRILPNIQSVIGLTGFATPAATANDVIKRIELTISPTSGAQGITLSGVCTTEPTSFEVTIGDDSTTIIVDAPAYFTGSGTINNPLTGITTISAFSITFSTDADGTSINSGGTMTLNAQSEVLGAMVITLTFDANFNVTGQAPYVGTVSIGGEQVGSITLNLSQGTGHITINSLGVNEDFSF